MTEPTHQNPANTNPQRSSNAQMAIEALRHLGIDMLFCLPGVQNDDFFNVLFDAADIRPIVTRHEQGASYMALGAAQATARPAAFCVVPGPGMLNAAAGLTSAYWTCAPVLALIGGVHSKLRGLSTGVLHDLPDSAAVLRQLTKHTSCVERGDQSTAVWQRAINEMVSGVPRPVAVEVPVDAWSRKTDATLEPPKANRPEINSDRIEEVARILGGAQRPLIMVGGGAQNASEPVRELADALEAPVFTHRMGLGVINTRHRLHAFLTMGHELWQSADVVIGIGTRMEFPNLQWRKRPEQTIIQINLDADELDRYNTGAIGVHGDAAAACQMLLDALGRHNRQRPDRTAELASLRADHFKKIAYLEPQLSYLRALRSVLPDDGIIVEDVTQVAFVAHLGYEHRQPRSYLSTGATGTLGAGVAHGIGVAAAVPNRAQVTIVGDGGMLFTATELATAAQYQINTTVLLFDNAGYGNVRRMQQQRFGDDRTIASSLRNPDWITFGESFGVHTQAVSGPEDLPQALEKALTHQGPSLLVAQTADEPDPWPLLRIPQ